MLPPLFALFIALIAPSFATLAAAPAKATPASIEALALKLAYPKAAGKYTMRKTKAEREAAARDAAVGAGVAAIKKGQTDVYATPDTPEQILAYYHVLLTKLGFKNVAPKSGAGNVLNSGYQGEGVIVTLTAVSDPDNNISLEKGQSIPKGNQAVVVGINAEL
jgi:hypothetical protein